MAIKQKEVNGIGSIIASVKSWAQGLFSTLGHKHAQEDITDFFHEHKALNVKVADKDDSDTPAGVKENINTSASVQAHVNTIYGQTADLYANKANKSHTHKREQITNFSHTHTKSEITDFPTIPSVSGKIGFPNYKSASPVTMPPTTYNVSVGHVSTVTAPYDCWCCITNAIATYENSANNVKVYVDGTYIGTLGGYENSHGIHGLFPVKSGSAVSVAFYIQNGWAHDFKMKWIPMA